MNRPGYLRSPEHDDFWIRDRGAQLGRIRLFFEESGGAIGRDGIACDRTSLETLFRPHDRGNAGPEDHDSGKRSGGVKRGGVTP
jgi:hypothetical protein